MKTMQRLFAVALAAAVSLSVSPELYAKGGGGGGGFGGGRSSFSGGGFSRPSGSPSGGFFKSPSPAPMPAPKYTAPPPAPVRVAPPPPPPAPKAPAPAATPQPPQNQKFFAKEAATPGFDKKAAEAQKHADSAKAFQEAQARKVAAQPQAAPQPTSAAPQVATQSARVYDLQAIRAARAAREAELSARMSRGDYVDRQSRAQVYYGPIYSQPMPTYYGSSGYNDSFNPYFWYWLMHRSDAAERDRFIYNHQGEIDPRRLQELKTAYPEMAASVDAYAARGETQDTSYVPASFAGNEDLVYGEDVVKAATEKAAEVKTSDKLWLALGFIALAAALAYLLFGAKYTVRRSYA